MTTLAPECPPQVRLASLPELQSHPYHTFVRRLSAFATAACLRVEMGWSKEWEYPWLWEHGLGDLDWSGLRLVDLGSELSPLPWFMATIGARVTLIETDARWVKQWSILRERLEVDVDWHIVNSEHLPLPDAEADAITSFSVVEHQPDKRRAVDELARVLKPGGRLAISFDICEPDLGMTFPEWNGRALTMAEFEDVFWRHPAFSTGQRLVWNRDDIAAFWQWHRGTEPHHNYVTGAAVLTRSMDY